MIYILSGLTSSNNVLSFHSETSWIRNNMDSLIKSESSLESDSDHEVAENQEVKKTKPLYVIHHNQNTVGFRHSYKSALRAIKKLQTQIRRSKGLDHPKMFEWVEWAPKSSTQQHFILESWNPMIINFMRTKDEELILERVTYLN